MHSVAKDTAVSKPNVTTVRLRSLSIVLGTPTMRTPFFARALAMVSEPSPPTATTASMPFASRAFDQLVRAVHLDHRPVRLLHRELEGIPGVRRADDRPPEVRDAPDQLGGQRDEPPVGVLVGQEDPVVAVADADHLPALVVRGQDDGADDGIEPGRVAAPGADAHAANPLARDIGFVMSSSRPVRGGKLYAARRAASRFKPEGVRS